MEFILFTGYMSRAPLSPREGYSTIDEAVKRINRQASKEVATMVTQVVMNASRVSGPTILNNDFKP